MVGIGRVDPHRLLVDVHAGTFVRSHESPAAVFGDAISVTQHVDALGIVGVTAHFGGGDRIHHLPARAAVVGAIQALVAGPGRDGGKDSIGMAGADRQADLAHVSAGKPSAEALPVVAAVSAAEDTALGAAAEEAPHAALALEGGGVQ